MSTTETKDVLKLLIDAYMAVKAAKEDDGKITIGDFPKFIALFPQAYTAIIGAEKIPAEISTLTLEEGADLATYVVTGFAVTDEHAKEIVAEAVKTAFAIWNLYKVISKKPELTPAA